MDKSQTRLELVKLVWNPGHAGDKASEAVALAKKLEAYVLAEAPDDPRPGTPPALSGRRR